MPDGEPIPASRFGHSLTAMPGRTGGDEDGKAGEVHVLVLFGGDDGSHLTSPRNYIGNYFSDTWILTPQTGGVDGGQQLGSIGLRWQRLEQVGAPEGRSAHATFVSRGCLYIFGGFPGPSNDMSRLCSPLSPGAAWEGVHTSLSPPPRYHSAMVADKEGAVAFLFGGFQSFKVNLNDLWRFDVSASAWQELLPTSEASAAVPSPRGGFSLLFAPNSGTTTRLVLFGGATCRPICKCHNDLWEYTLPSGGWREVTGDPAHGPSTRHKQASVATEAGLVVFGGEGYRFAHDYHDDLWLLSPAAPPPQPADSLRALESRGSGDAAQVGDAQVEL
ncbi:hypothetical protein T484DRAFT_1934698 [Baffinella frigidus]|nr:hypothetical protein T484DRAFT_1934698 [Cryptophyta sp. CCMP2293]